MLTPEERITSDTYDREARRWSSEHMTAGFWSEEMTKLHQILPRGRILEIGAGSGRDARELTDLGYDYVGTDISKGLLAQARINNPGLTFMQKSVYELDYNKEFDGFWCAAVLLHIPRTRTQEALSNIRRAMKPSAVGFIAIKEGEGEGLEEDEFGQRFFTYWRNDDFKDALSRSNFMVVSEGYRPMSERTKWLTYIVGLGKS